MDPHWLSRDAVYIDKRDPVRTIVGHLRGDRDETVIVCDDGRPYGLIHPRKVTAGGWYNDTTVDRLAWPVPVVNDNDTVRTATKKFVDSGAPVLPARMEGEAAGYLDAGFLLHEGHAEGPGVPRALQQVPILRPEATMIDALRGFGDSNANILPVESQHGLEGVLHRRVAIPYLTSAEHGHGRQDLAADTRQLVDDPIRDKIDAAPATIRLGAGFDEAKELLRDVREAVVLDGTNVAGLLSPGSVLRAITSMEEDEPSMPTHFRQPKAEPR